MFYVNLSKHEHVILIVYTFNKNIRRAFYATENHENLMKKYMFFQKSQFYLLFKHKPFMMKSIFRQSVLGGSCTKDFLWETTANSISALSWVRLKDCVRWTTARPVLSPATICALTLTSSPSMSKAAPPLMSSWKKLYCVQDQMRHWKKYLVLVYHSSWRTEVLGFSG